MRFLLDKKKKETKKLIHSTERETLKIQTPTRNSKGKKP